MKEAKKEILGIRLIRRLLNSKRIPSPFANFWVKYMNLIEKINTGTIQKLVAMLVQTALGERVRRLLMSSPVPLKPRALCLMVGNPYFFLIDPEDLFFMNLGLVKNHIFNLNERSANR